MLLRRANSAEESVALLNNALCEAADRKARLRGDNADLARLPARFEPLEQRVQGLYRDRREANRHFAGEAPTFTEPAHLNGDEMPYITLLKQIDETRRTGLEVDGEAL